MNSRLRFHHIVFLVETDIIFPNDYVVPFITSYFIKCLVSESQTFGTSKDYRSVKFSSYLLQIPVILITYN